MAREKFAQTYGWFEARIQVPRGAGLWPAFWLYGDTPVGPDGTPGGGEIDVMEHVGHEPAAVYGSVHGADGFSRVASYTLPEPAMFADGFHVFAVEWAPDGVTFLVDGEPITEDDVFSMVELMLAGGTGTTASLVSNTVVWLYKNPAVRQDLIDHPDKLERAIEEFLRYFSPTQSLARTVTRDTEFLGCPMREGDRVLLSWASANRDEKVFENADELDIAGQRDCEVGTESVAVTLRLEGDRVAVDGLPGAGRGCSSLSRRPAPPAAPSRDAE